MAKFFRRFIILGFIIFEIAAQALLVINILKVKDKIQVNIKTDTSNMFAKRAEYNKQENIIELFENVIIIRDNELITGDYAKINTLDESYFVKTNKSKRVKALLSRVDE